MVDRVESQKIYFHKYLANEIIFLLIPKRMKFDYSVQSYSQLPNLVNFVQKPRRFLWSRTRENSKNYLFSHTN